MIQVTVELYPSNGSGRRVLGVIDITNNGRQSDGSGDSRWGDYDVVLYNERGLVERRLRYSDYDRRQGFGPLLAGIAKNLWG